MSYEPPIVPRVFDSPAGIDLAKLALKHGPAVENDHALLAAIEAVRVAPETCGGLVALGEKLLRLGAHEKAQAAFEDALIDDPNSLEALQGVALALRGQARAGDDRDLMLRAIRAFELLADRSPNSPGPLMFVATSWNHLGDAQKVAEAADRVLKISPENTIAWEFLGHARMKLREFADAAQAFGHAIELEAQDSIMPGRADLLGARGRALFLAGKIEEAAPLLLRAAMLDPHDIESYNWAALCFNDLKRELPPTVAPKLPRESDSYATPVLQMPEKLKSIYFDQLRQGLELPVRSSTKAQDSFFINLAIDLRDDEKITYQLQLLPLQKGATRDCWARIENQKAGYRLLFFLSGSGSESRALLQSWRGLNLVKARKIKEAVDLLSQSSADSEVLVMAKSDLSVAITGEECPPDWSLSLGTPQDALVGAYKLALGGRVLNPIDGSIKAELRIFLDRDQHRLYGLEIQRVGPDRKAISTLKSERLGLLSEVTAAFRELSAKIMED
ncbi:MAG: hypothetical protein K1X83_08515 [Oligoflexia bacterium]|nr:hypothetical protein [Oligoflexia bacterium]